MVGDVWRIPACRKKIMSDTGYAMEPPTENDKWWFTFGSGVDDLNRNCYIVIKGSYADARIKMIERFGTKWCSQYPTAEEAGVKEFNLKETT